MEERTNEEWVRFSEIMYEKHRRQLDMWPNHDDAVRAIIQGVIADTNLLDEDLVTLEAWEEALATDNDVFRSFWGTAVPPVVG